MIPEDLAVLRVTARVGQGGHGVPEDNVRTRWARLWEHVEAAAPLGFVSGRPTGERATGQDESR
jgi:predicted ABC-type ATPase